MADGEHECKWENCNRRFTSSKDLHDHLVKDHLLLQTNEDDSATRKGKKKIPFETTCKWKDCGKTHNSKKLDNAKSHILVHSKYKSFACEKCHRPFRHNHVLTRHSKSCKKKEAVQPEPGIPIFDDSLSRARSCPQPGSSLQTSYTQPGSSLQTSYTQPGSSLQTSYTQPGSSLQTSYTQPGSSLQTSYTQPGSSIQTSYTQPDSSLSTSYTQPDSGLPTSYTQLAVNDYPRLNRLDIYSILQLANIILNAHELDPQARQESFIRDTPEQRRYVYSQPTAPDWGGELLHQLNPYEPAISHAEHDYQQNWRTILDSFENNEMQRLAPANYENPDPVRQLDDSQIPGSSTQMMPGIMTATQTDNALYHSNAFEECFLLPQLDQDESESLQTDFSNISQISFPRGGAEYEDLLNVGLVEAHKEKPEGLRKRDSFKRPLAELHKFFKNIAEQTDAKIKESRSKLHNRVNTPALDKAESSKLSTTSNAMRDIAVMLANLHIQVSKQHDDRTQTSHKMPTDNTLSRQTNDQVEDNHSHEEVLSTPVDVKCETDNATTSEESSEIKTDVQSDEISIPDVLEEAPSPAVAVFVAVWAQALRKRAEKSRDTQNPDVGSNRREDQDTEEFIESDERQEGDEEYDNFKPDKTQGIKDDSISAEV